MPKNKNFDQMDWPLGYEVPNVSLVKKGPETSPNIEAPLRRPSELTLWFYNTQDRFGSWVKSKKRLLEQFSAADKPPKARSVKSIVNYTPDDQEYTAKYSLLNLK